MADQTWDDSRLPPHIPEQNVTNPLKPNGTPPAASAGNPQPPYTSWLPSSVAPKKAPVKEEFKADSKDIIFALIVWILGYLFVRWLLFSWQGWGVALFTVLYCGAIVGYLLKKDVKIPREGWFWLTVTTLTGLSYALWVGNGLEPFRGIFLFSTAVYSMIASAGVQILGKTGNWLFLDGLNAIFIIPFRNFGAQYQCLASMRKNEVKGRKVYSVVLGIALGLIVVGMVTPLLLEADSGGFSNLVSGILEWLEQFLDTKTIIQLILAIPVAAYLFGLIYGCANRRRCSSFQVEHTEKSISALRILPSSTVYTLLGIVCVLYLLFIGTQLSYFFAAFSGNRPEGWEVYSEYARRGFFELCAIAAINLSLITASNLLCKTPRTQARGLKAYNTILMGLTMLLIGTALSKMILYVSAYGLSMRRLLPCVFMIFLLVVCAGVIVLQKHLFSILRFAVVVGSVMFCLLCLSDPDGFVVRYNADRYLNGTLAVFDVDILYRSGPAGMDGAMEVYKQTGDAALKFNVWSYINVQLIAAADDSGKASDNLQQMLIRNDGYPEQ